MFRVLKEHEVLITNGDDITVRLTRWCEQFEDRTATQELMDQAAREIERLRLTDAEREAVEWYADFPDGIHADTLRKLLERVK
jgi:hypothetical protein